MVPRRVLFIILMCAPGVGIVNADPLADRAKARELISAGQWADAVNVLTGSLDANPYNGEDWYLLGVAYARLGNCDEAAPLLSRSIELGADGTTGGMRDAHLEAAACAAGLGDPAPAIEHLGTAQARYKFADFGRLRGDPRFAPLVDHPEYRRLTGSRDWSDADRVEGWSADLDYFLDLMERRHPAPFHTVDEKTWRDASAALRKQMRDLSDLQVVGAFMRLAAMIGDGHTSFYPPFDGPMAFHLTPIWPYAFGDEWRIIAAAPEFPDLVGARIVAVEGVPMAEAAERIAAHLPRDNAMTPRWMTGVALQFAEMSASIFAAQDPCCLTMDVELESGEQRVVRLPGRQFDRDPMAPWVPAAWPGVAAKQAPLWLSNTGTNVWFEEIPALDAIYAQVNRIRDDDERSFEQSARELTQRVTERNARHLILDLRHNNGGNGYLNWPLVREIVRTEAIDHPDGLFVIIGRRTFSAAMLLTSMLEFHTEAIFVGEPTGSRPQFYGEDTLFELPYSGLKGSISSRWFQNRFVSDDERPWIAPDIVARLEFNDLRDGRDPALAAIEEYLRTRSR